VLAHEDSFSAFSPEERAILREKLAVLGHVLEEELKEIQQQELDLYVSVCVCVDR
jgi:hypothetical protein